MESEIAVVPSTTDPNCTADVLYLIFGSGFPAIVVRYACVNYRRAELLFPMLRGNTKDATSAQNNSVRCESETNETQLTMNAETIAAGCLLRAIKQTGSSKCLSKWNRLIRHGFPVDTASRNTPSEMEAVALELFFTQIDRDNIILIESNFRLLLRVSVDPDSFTSQEREAVGRIAISFAQILYKTPWCLEPLQAAVACLQVACELSRTRVDFSRLSRATIFTSNLGKGEASELWERFHQHFEKPNFWEEVSEIGKYLREALAASAPDQDGVEGTITTENGLDETLESGVKKEEALLELQ